MRLVQHINPRSMSGAPLDIWGRRVRLAYLDEAGVGNIQEDPYLVVAGIILNGDQDWRPLQRYIKGLRRKYLPSEDQDLFIFHAKDILHGTGYFKKDRTTKWPRQKRLEILLDFADIPRRFRLPVVQECIDRVAIGKWFQAGHQRRLRPRHGLQGRGVQIFPTSREPLPARTVANLIHASAFVSCAARIDLWMKAHAPNEIAMIVAEKPGKIEEGLRMFHQGYASDELYQYNPRAFSTDRIIDTIAFAGKNELILLQIADVCAFVIKRRLAGKEDVKEAFERLDGQLTSPLELSR